MSTSNTNKKKYKKPNQRLISTANSEPSNSRPEIERSSSEPVCPLLAKDSEWVDILQTPLNNDGLMSSSRNTGEEEVLQLVDSEDEPQPLAIMFPGLMERDPQTLQGMLTKAMSTTEVTRHLVDLGQKANFTFLKKADRLIPRDKQWLESLTENSNSVCSMQSALLNNSVTSDYDADSEVTEPRQQSKKKKKLKEKSLRDENSKSPEIKIASDHNYDADNETSASAGNRNKK